MSRSGSDEQEDADLAEAIHRSLVLEEPEAEAGSGTEWELVGQVDGSDVGPSAAPEAPPLRVLVRGRRRGVPVGHALGQPRSGPRLALQLLLLLSVAPQPQRSQ